MFVEEKEDNNDFEKVKILFDSFSKNDCYRWCKKVHNQKSFFKNIFIKINQKIILQLMTSDIFVIVSN